MREGLEGRRSNFGAGLLRNGELITGLGRVGIVLEVLMYLPFQ